LGGSYKTSLTIGGVSGGGGEENLVLKGESFFERDPLMSRKGGGGGESWVELGKTKASPLTRTYFAIPSALCIQMKGDSKHVGRKSTMAILG